MCNPPLSTADLRLIRSPPALTTISAVASRTQELRLGIDLCCATNSTAQDRWINHWGSDALYKITLPARG